MKNIQGINDAQRISRTTHAQTEINLLAKAGGEVLLIHHTNAPVTFSQQTGANREKKSV